MSWSAMPAAKMSPQQKEFFHDNVRLGLSIDYYPTQTALMLEEALETPDNAKSLALIRQTLPILEVMEKDIRRAERSPFEGWYRPTWIRVADYFNGWSDMNPHRPYDMVNLFLEGRERSALTPHPAVKK